MKKIIFILTMLLSSMSFADVVNSFTVNGDEWQIRTIIQDDGIFLCKMEGGGCISAGIGVYWDFYDVVRGDTMTARDYYRSFLDKAQSKLVDYYLPIDATAPEEDQFVAFLEYLIQSGTRYNEGDKSFSITK